MLSVLGRMFDGYVRVESGQVGNRGAGRRASDVVVTFGEGYIGRLDNDSGGSRPCGCGL